MLAKIRSCADAVFWVIKAAFLCKENSSFLTPLLQSVVQANCYSFCLIQAEGS